MKALSVIACVVAMFAVASVASAEPPERGERGERRGPPAEAVQACASAEVGATCSFEGRRRTVTGTCKQVRNNQIVCVPKNHKRQRRQRRQGDRDREQN